MDYSTIIIPTVKQTIESLLGECTVEASDRVPDYSESTTDVIYQGMEVCSISKRKDYSGAKVLEVAIGMDRLVYLFNKKNEITSS